MRTQTIKISIIVPIYNAAKCLRQCIDSILNQTFEDFELLLIDDGSTDESSVICDEYSAVDSRVRVFHRPNGGVSSARNLGLDNVNGKWILFIDADDMIYPEMLLTLYNVSSDNEIIFFSVTELFEDGTQIEYKAKECETKKQELSQMQLLYLKNNETGYPFFGYVWSKMFCRDIIEKFNIRFINDFALFEDEVFTDEYCKNITSLKIISTPLYCYRRSNFGLTGRKRSPKDLLILSQKLLTFYESYIYEPLKIYELERSLSFLKEAIDKDINLEFYNEEQHLLAQIEADGKCLYEGARLKILRTFRKLIGARLLILCKLIK